jgi:hypothetical protein
VVNELSGGGVCSTTDGFDGGMRDSIQNILRANISCSFIP